MTNIQRILVAVHNQDDGEIVLEKARQLAAATGASLHVVRVVHEAFAELSIHDIETSNELKTYVLQAEESWLVDLIEPLRKAGLAIESATVWNKAEWQGILDVAGDCDAQLIIKGTATSDEGLLRTPSDWNLLRYAEAPVMLVKPVSWGEHPVVLAAIDAAQDSDEALNLKVLGRAQELADQLGGELHIVSAYPSYDRWADPTTISIEYDAIHKAMRETIEHKIDHLVSIGKARPKAIHTAEGNTDVIIDMTAADVGAQLLVLGTHHHTGARGVIMGNTSEGILHSVRCDVEVLY